MRARALRAPVFSGSLTRQTGRCAPPPPLVAASLFLIRPPKIYIKYIELGPPMSKGFFFPLDHRGYEIGGPMSPAPPIATSLILPAIFLGSQLCLGAPSFFGFFLFSIVFGYFLFVIPFFFFSPFQLLLILLFFSVLILLFLYFNWLLNYRHPH